MSGCEKRLAESQGNGKRLTEANDGVFDNLWRYEMSLTVAPSLVVFHAAVINEAYSELLSSLQQTPSGLSCLEHSACRMSFCAFCSVPAALWTLQTGALLALLLFSRGGSCTALDIFCFDRQWCGSRSRVVSRQAKLRNYRDAAGCATCFFLPFAATLYPPDCRVTAHSRTRKCHPVIDLPTFLADESNMSAQYKSTSAYLVVMLCLSHIMCHDFRYDI